MRAKGHPALSLHPPGSRLAGYVLALGAVAVVTLIRLAADPLVHDQIPYFAYAAAVVVATWFGGVAGGVVSTIASALAGNYLFVQPRNQLTLHREDWIAMILFAGVASVLVWLVGRWKRAETEAGAHLTNLETAGEAARRRAEELQKVLDTVPAAVFVTRDPDAHFVEVNRYAREVLRISEGNVSKSPAAGEPVPSYRIMRNGCEVSEGAMPLQRTLATGRGVPGWEFDVVYDDGTVRTLFGNTVPLRDERGGLRGAIGTFVDITEHRRLEQKLKQAVAELETRVRELDGSQEIAHLGSWELDLEANRLWWSDEVYRIFGLRPQEFAATYEAFLDAVHPDDRAAVDAAYSASLTGGRDSYEIEHRVVRRSTGEIRVVHEKCRHVRDGVGRIVRSLGMVHDITERKLAEETLRDANRMKDEFLATLSHELRTPLNAIVGWSDMLLRGKLNTGEMRRAVESIHRNARVQSDLIADVLDVSRIISGKVRLQPQPMDLPLLLQNAIESVRAAADARNVAIAQQVGTLPFPVSGDATRIQQVFWNLLSNAIKFTPSGGSVRVSMQTADNCVQVRVADTGIGIAADFLPHVFERFRQRDSSSTRAHGGLGLGLAIVRHLVELHGGSVTAESAGEGKGSTFTVTLPAVPFHERRHREQDAGRHVPPFAPLPDAAPSLHGLRVLVVDDECDARELSASVLRHHGAEVALADSGEQALQQFEAFDPHVLLVDIAMPGMDGYGLIQRIRTSNGQKGKVVPAIAFTAYAREEDERRALANGFHLHIAKPVDSYTLVRAIASAHRAGGAATV